MRPLVCAEVNNVETFRVEAAREVVNRILVEKKVVYGINTGFGNFAKCVAVITLSSSSLLLLSFPLSLHMLLSVVIAPDKVGQLQVNLIRSHAAGVGHYLPLYQVLT